MSASLAVVISHHNDLERLEQRLIEVQDADLIVILEDPSEVTPAVHALAVKHRAFVKEHVLQDDFAAHRNSVFKHIQAEWVWFLDVDESVTRSLWNEVQEHLTDSELQALILPRRDYFLGKLLQHGETGRMALLRIARLKAGRDGWKRAVHEVWEVPGPSRLLLEPLLHFPHASIKEFLQTLHWYAQLEPGTRQRLSRRKVVFQLLTYPSAKLFKAIVLQGGWQDGWPGIIHAGLMAYNSLITRVYMYEEWYGQKLELS